MVLCGSSEPDPCCVWSQAEEASLCPAGPGRCFGLFLSAGHVLIEIFGLWRGSFCASGRVEYVPADLEENQRRSLLSVFACIRSQRVAPRW